MPFLSMSTFPAAAGLAALTALVVATGLARAGWLGGRDRIERIVWSSDGSWLLADAQGRSFEGTLRDDSRVGNHLVWLRWNASRTRSMLLVSGDIATAELRRLVVRLRLEGVRPVRRAQDASHSNR